MESGSQERGAGAGSSDEETRSIREAGCRTLKTGAVYARVSTDRQERQETVASQLDALRQAAVERGIEILPEHVFVDKEVSGARLDRPGLDRLRDLASEGMFDVVLVYAPDRLARQYAYQVVVMEELKRHGCEVVFLNHAFGETPEQQMLLQIQGVFAEYERALIQERTRRGRLYAARQGRLNGGAVPYGYRWIRKTENGPQKVEVDETKAEVVREIFRAYVEEGKSCKSLRDSLNARSVPPLRNSPRGWQFSSVYAVLTNPWYKGLAYYNRTQKADARHPQGKRSFKDYGPGNGRGRSLRANEDWIPMRVPAIVEAEIWERAQEQIRLNKVRSPRNNKKHEYLLRSLLICGRCGRRMAGTVQKGRTYYICAARYPKNKPWSCDGKKIVGEPSEDWIWSHVKRLLSDPEVLKQQYDQGRGDPAANPRADQEAERIDRRLKALNREVQRLIDAYQAEVIDLEELESRRKQAQDHRRLIEQRRRDLQRQQADRDRELRLLEGLDAFCKSVQGSLQDPPFEVKQSVLRLVVERIVVEENRVVVQHVVPTEKFRLIPEWWAVRDSNPRPSACRADALAN